LKELKSIPLELKDVDLGKRKAVIAHATFNNIDRSKDMIAPGAFKKSWQESKDDVSFYLNHDDTQAPGKIVNLYEDDKHAYTEVKMGTHTLGEDTLKMMDEGIIKNASFGFNTVKSQSVEVKGEKVRKLTELKHWETSVLTKIPCNPASGIISVTKSFDHLRTELKTLNADEQAFLQTIIRSGQSSLEAAISLASVLDVSSDLYTFIQYFISETSSQMGSLKSQLRWGMESVKSLNEHITNLEAFCRNTTASDETIKMISKEVDEIKGLISNDTADTSDGKPAASIENEYADQVLAQLLLIGLKN
jgi:HK97 family phage prohead protease